MKISAADSAFDDLAGIIAHYNDEGVPDIGQTFVAEILGRIDRLSDHPDMGRIVPEFELEHIRELIHPPFRIVYLRESEAVTIIRVWRSERLLILAVERGGS